MKKLLILSGKGGTGKTTTAAAIIQFAQAQAMADCDVDAPNLHLVTQVTQKPEEAVFYGGDKARIDSGRCIGCGKCMDHCRFGAILREGDKCRVLDYACEGCGVCQLVCPAQAVTLEPDEAGLLTVYFGSPFFSTATLKMGRGNSGKLVSEVKAALDAAEGVQLAVIDGSPGIGCPVIASVSGVDLVLVVAEPSMSGLSDLKRLLETASTMECMVAVCVNKYDTSPEKSDEIQSLCRLRHIPFVGTIPYDPSASKAINRGESIAHFPCPARTALYQVYRSTMELLDLPVLPMPED